jgi:hypothetical protein
VAFLPTECACPRIAGRNATGGEKRNEVSKSGARSAAAIDVELLI